MYIIKNVIQEQEVFIKNVIQEQEVFQPANLLHG